MTKEFFERGKQIAKWADNNMTKDEALKMAYDWLNEYAPPEVVQACKEALEQEKMMVKYNIKTENKKNVTHGSQTEALKMAIEALDESMPLVFGNGIALEIMKTPLLEVERKVNFHKKAIQTCKDALAQPEQYDLIQGEPLDADDDGLYYVPKQPAQEPVAERFLMKDKGKSYWAYSDYDNSKDWQPLYTRPCALARMAPSWQGLKIKEIWEIVEDIEDDDGINMEEFARAIEQALKEKNYAN